MLQPFPGLASFTQELSNDAATTKAAANHLTHADPNALFVHFDDGDHVGHQHGFSPAVPQYTAQVALLDAHIGTALLAFHGRPNYTAENWLVLMTTDHGGRGTRHGGHSAGGRQTWIIASGRTTANATRNMSRGMTAITRMALQHLDNAICLAGGLTDTQPSAQLRPRSYSPSAPGR